MPIDYGELWVFEKQMLRALKSGDSIIEWLSANKSETSKEILEVINGVCRKFEWEYEPFPGIRNRTQIVVRNKDMFVHMPIRGCFQNLQILQQVVDSAFAKLEEVGKKKMKDELCSV